MLVSLILYAAAVTGLILAVIRKKWMAVFCFFAFGALYVWLTGPVAMPRYQLPALPVFCAFAAYAFEAWRKREKAPLSR